MIQYRRLGEILLDKGLITSKQLERALRAQTNSHRRFGEILTVLGFVSEDDVTACLAEQFDCPVVDLDAATPEPEAMGMVDKSFALGRLLLPLRISGGTIECVICDPLDMSATDSLAASTRLRPRFFLAPPTKLFEAIRRAYGEVVSESDAPLPSLEIVTGGGAKLPRSRVRKVEVQADRVALLEALAKAPAPPSRKNMWKQLTNS